MNEFIARKEWNRIDFILAGRNWNEMEWNKNYFILHSNEWNSIEWKKISFLHGSRISFSMAAAINTSMKLAATSLGLAVRLGLLKLACWQSLVPSVDFEVNHLHFSMCTTSKSWKPASQNHVCTRESLVNTIVENKLWWTTDHVLSPFNSPMHLPICAINTLSSDVPLHIVNSPSSLLEVGFLRVAEALKYHKGTSAKLCVRS